jgi:hypothetical protein
MSNGPTHRSLGLTVPVTEALDPQKWRERYAYGLVLGTAAAQPTAELKSSAVRALLNQDRCGDRAPKTAQAMLAKAQGELTQAVNEIPNHVIQWHLRVAASKVETRLRMPLGVVVVKGAPADDGLVQGVHFDKLEARRPFVRSEQQSHYRIDLPAGVVSVERVRAYFYGTLVWEISATANNAAMLRLSWPGVSHAHILPHLGGPTLLLSVPGNGLSMAAATAFSHFWGMNSPIPDVWALDYTLAPTTKTGEVGQIEAVLADYIYAHAGAYLLTLGGRLATGGLQSASISIDGLSRSVSLAGRSLNEILTERLEKATADADFDSLRTYKKGLRVLPYGH